MDETRHTVTVAVSGASGTVYALRLVEVLLNSNYSVDMLVSAAAIEVLNEELKTNLSDDKQGLQNWLQQCYPQGSLKLYGEREWQASVASGSACNNSMVVVPCSMGSLAAIAHGNSDNLLERAADVTIKENKQLILVPRETPLSVIHLENMLKLANIGVTILPATPGFYHQPKSIEELVDFIVARILDHLKVPHELISSWG